MAHINVSSRTILADSRDARHDGVNAMPELDHTTQLSFFDTIEIPLTKGYITVVDALDADLAEHKWCVSSRRYATLSVLLRGKRTLTCIHNAILERVIGRALLKGEEVDHIDGDRLNNRRNNLRLATHAQNMANRKLQKNNKSNFRGVSFHKGSQKWRAEIQKEGTKTNLGYFNTPEEAYAAYLEASNRLFGEFARNDNKEVR